MVYELSGSSTYRVDPAKHDDYTLTIRDGDITVKATMIAEDVLTLKRNLAHLVDADVDPNVGGFSIKDLVALRRKFDDGGIVDDDMLSDVLDAYIRLIERAKSEYASGQREQLARAWYEGHMVGWDERVGRQIWEDGGREGPIPQRAPCPYPITVKAASARNQKGDTHD